MKAVSFDSFGGPEVLTYGDRPDPEPGDGWELVELRAAALNWHDCLLRAGTYDFQLPRIPGSDGAGVRASDGSDVLIMPSLFWGDREAAPGPDWEILGDRTDGTYAEQIAIPSEAIQPMPAGWSYEEAAALPLAGLTAHRALFGRGSLQAGETVLVLGASGGVATIAVALARLAGARVLVTSSTREKLERAIELGANGGTLYSEDGWQDRVKELSGGGVDLVVDSVGEWQDSIDCLRTGGRVVTFGATRTDRSEIAVRPYYFGQYSILGTTMGSPRDFAGLLDLLDGSSDWRPEIGRVFGLREAADAHREMESGAGFGKIVLRIGGES